MADQSTISFELARFEWADPQRLELEGSWNGVTRRLARATLVIEVDGRRRRLRALPEDAGTPEQWTAAFGWNGDDIPRLHGAELEVGRGIVVDLPRPRSSKARAELPAEPIPATTRDDKDAGPGRAEAERLLEALSTARDEAKEAKSALKTVKEERDGLRAERQALRTERDTLQAEQEELRARAGELESLRAEHDALRAEQDDLRTRAGEADALRTEQDDLRARAEGLETLRAEHDALRAEYDDLRARAGQAGAEHDDLRARAEAADAELISLRGLAEEADALRARAEAAEAALAAPEGGKEVAPDVARLRAELASVERERTELRAKLESTAEKLEDATQSMPPPTLEDGDDPRERLREARRFDRPREAAELRRSRRPAERTAKRSPEPTASLADKVTDWVGGVIGTRDDEGSKNGESHAATRTRAKPDVTAEAAPSPAVQAVSRRRRATAMRTAPRQRRESPSWALRVAAIGLLALLLITLAVIVSSIL